VFGDVLDEGAVIAICCQIAAVNMLTSAENTTECLQVLRRVSHGTLTPRIRKIDGEVNWLWVDRSWLDGLRCLKLVGAETRWPGRDAWPGVHGSISKVQLQPRSCTRGSRA